MIEAARELLGEAIERNYAAVLAFPSSGMLRHHKTRFLAAADEGFWIESVPGQAALIDQLAAEGIEVGVAFKSPTNKIVFATRIVRREPAFQVNRELAVEALLMAPPASIKSVQRRSCYRVHLPMAESAVRIRVWRIPEHAVLRDRPPASSEIVVRPRDISVGGLCLLLPPQDECPQRIVAGQRLRIHLECFESEVLVEGRVQHVAATPDHSLRIGIQFKKLENDLDGRQTLSRLTRIVGDLHRVEVRRARLGLEA